MPRTTPAPRPGPQGASTPGAELGLGRVAPREWGYSTSEVDALLGQHLGADARAAGEGAEQDGLPDPRQLRRAVFRRQRGGYAPADVDAAIDRLEDEAAQARTRDFIRDHGEQAWHDRVDEQLEVVLGRLVRPAGHRFRTPSSAAARGYSAEEVDELCDRLHGQLLGHDAPRAAEVRAAVFAPAWGEAVYEEHQVDAFLDAVVDLLHCLD